MRAIKSASSVVLSAPRVLLALAAAALVASCATQTTLVRNERLPADIKAKGLKHYRQIVLVTPEPDPREVTPRVARRLEAMGYKVRVVKADQSLAAPQGTGFLVSADGYLLTCAHVVEGEKTATVFFSGKRMFADVVSSDKDQDVAVLKLQGEVPAGASPLSFRADTAYTMGEDVFTIGFPISRILGGARMSKGLVSSTTGVRDDPREVQVSAEIQPGNSGGPLLDGDGRVMGIVNQSMNAMRFAQATGGALPQNINFAIKNEFVLAYVRTANSGLHETLIRNANHPMARDKAAKAVVKVLAGTVVDDDYLKTTMLVRVGYVSILEVWYRFLKFGLIAYDMDSQESLFEVGQNIDNRISNENLAIEETLKRFKETIEQ